MIKIKALEAHPRSIAKAITYRVCSLAVDFTVAYLFLHDVVRSVGIVLIVNGYSTILYYLHERMWAHIHWGHTPVVQVEPISFQTDELKNFS